METHLQEHSTTKQTRMMTSRCVVKCQQSSSRFAISRICSAISSATVAMALSACGAAKANGQDEDLFGVFTKNKSVITSHNGARALAPYVYITVEAPLSDEYDSLIRDGEELLELYVAFSAAIVEFTTELCTSNRQALPSPGALNLVDLPFQIIHEKRGKNNRIRVYGSQYEKISTALLKNCV